MVLLDYAAGLFIYLLLIRKKHGRKIVQNTLFFLYIIIVLSITLFPVISSIPGIFSHGYSVMNFVPFIDFIYGRGDFKRQIILNIFMFIPFGFLLPQAMERPSFKKTIFAAFLFSLSIELLQPLLNQFRISDITDIITNTTGAFAGYLAYLMFSTIYRMLPVQKNIPDYTRSQK